MSDIITELLDNISQFITDDIKRDLEYKLRQKFGGDAVYICKREVDYKKQIIDREMSRGKTIMQIQKEHGISRSTIYSLLKKRG